MPSIGRARAAAALEETAPAAVIRDNENRETTRVALLFVGLTGDEETDAGLLTALRERGIPAAFALSAAEGLENGGLLDQITEDGFLLLSNGTDGSGNLQNCEPRPLVETMMNSRQTLSGAAGKPVTLFYGSSTQPTGQVLRGSFVCFNLGFYEQDQYAQPGNTVLGAMLDGFLTRHIDTLAYRAPETGAIEDGSRFAVTTVSEVLSAPQYTFVSGKQNVVTEDKNVLTNMDTEEARFDYIAAHYYGNVTVNVADKLPGFDRQEIQRLDKSGTFTDDKVLFLTFDDWGTEQSINELLYVLEKHGVKATFFVKTQYVDANPNLLRAIAEQGHQIASHTDGHIPLADSDPKNENRMYSLTEEEAAALRKDLVLSYDKLYRYVGDVTVDGRPALTPMFRPPTLAVSKIGMSQVFDVGFTDSISGAYSTGDYEASSYRDMLSRLTRIFSPA